MAQSAEDPRLTRVSEICLALPEATREAKGQHASFVVRKKVFAYYLNNHHGDRKVAVCGKVAIAENWARVEQDPKRYYLPAYIGPRGWVGLRLDQGEIDWEEVSELLVGSYRLVAPKRLGALLTLIKTIPHSHLHPPKR